MPITTYDLLPSMQVIGVGASAGFYPASGSVADCVTNTGWWENYGKNEPELRVAPTDSFMKAAKAKLRFTVPDLTGVDPGRVRLRLRGSIAWDGRIRDNVAAPGHIGEYVSFTVASSNAYTGVGGSFGRIRIRGEATLPGNFNVRKTSTKSYDSLTELYQETHVDTSVWAEGLTIVGGISFDELYGYYTNGTDPESFPAQFFDGGTTGHTIDLDFTFYTGYPTASGDPKVEFAYNINNLEVFLEVDADAPDPPTYYVPLAGQCDTIQTLYFGAVETSPTNDPWTVSWTKETVDAGLRWTATFTALEDLLHDAFLVLAGTITSDGGIGVGPEPSMASLNSAAGSPSLSGVSGVSLEPIITSPNFAAVRVAGGGTFNAGATLSLSFTAPDEFETHIAFALPGSITDPGGEGGWLSVNPTDKYIAAWTKNCGNPPEFQITWWEPGSKTYERGIDRGVLYFDDGRVVPWSGLTKVDESLGRNAESVYFDGVKLSEIVTPEGFSAQVSAITYPKQFEEAYGSLPLRRGVYLGGQRPKTFGFCYRTKLGTELDEDAGYKIHIIYNILAIPGNRSYSTISSEPNVTEFSWDFKTTPDNAPGFRPSAYLVFDSTKVTPSLLSELESVLYGTDTTPPRLPSLAELLSFIDNYNNFINIVDNGDGTWEANTLATGIINDLGGGVYEIQEATIQNTGVDTYLISPTPDPP